MVTGRQADMEQRDDCIFCKIVSGDIASFRLAEDDSCIAILDAFPTVKGHTLVLPKNHTTDMTEMNDAELSSVMNMARDVTRALLEVLGASAVNLISNVGKEAGQVVMHTHFHIIPRFENDALEISFKPKVKVSEVENYELVSRVREVLST